MRCRPHLGPATQTRSSRSVVESAAPFRIYEVTNRTYEVTNKAVMPVPIAEPIPLHGSGPGEAL